MSRFRLCLTALVCTWVCLTAADIRAEGAAEPLRVAVAANFRTTAVELGVLFEARSGTAVSISSASTGVLAAQVRRGAPFDLLLAADAARPDALHRDGFTVGPPRCYARGALVLLGAPDLDRALRDAELSLAMANPRSAPYGVAAEAVLNRPGFVGSPQRRVVMGTNVQQAMQFYERGAADLALVAVAVANGQGVAVPQDWHTPIEQHAVVLSASTRPDQARAFLDFLTGATIQAEISQRGYTPCS